MIYLVLFLFNDNLLILSHSIIFRSSSFTPDSVLLFGILSLQDLMVLNKVVSSAYIIKFNILLAFGKSFMYIINNKGPMTDPCGTPKFIDKISDLAFSNSTY